ncbi:MAG TPA: tetratricopeptide repeat protein [Bryobacteraceae bacterium]|nr:tetratricopeptide repeat protein [Bryobacteraceae bacterium]
MKLRPHVTIANFVLVLGCAGFLAANAAAQALVTQGIDKTPAAMASREKSLLQAVSDASQWQTKDPRVAKSYRDLADYYTAEGRYADAERPYQKRLELEEDALGRANPAIIPAIDDLARVNFAQMKYDQSADLIARELRIMEREYGDNDPKLVPSLEQTARVLQSGEKYTDAEKYLTRAVAIREKTSGAESLELVPDLSQLARVYLARQDLAGAGQLYERILNLQLKTLSSNSPALLPALDALADLSLEQHKDAEPLLKHTLSIREESLGPNHVDVARNLDKLATLYTGEKRFAEAEKAGERALFIWMKELKSGSPELAEKYQKMAELYEALDRPADAEPLVQQVLTARESETVASLNTLAAIYVSKHNLTEAEPLYRLSLTILDKRGILTGRRPAMVSGTEENEDLLAETALDYVDLLKKMRRKSDARRIEARLRAITGKTSARKKKES